MNINDLQLIELFDNENDESINFYLLRQIEINNTKYLIVVEEEYFDELLEEYQQDFEILRGEKDQDGDIFVRIDAEEDEEEFDMVMEMLDNIWCDE